MITASPRAVAKQPGDGVFVAGTVAAVARCASA